MSSGHAHTHAFDAAVLCSRFGASARRLSFRELAPGDGTVVLGTYSLPYSFHHPAGHAGFHGQNIHGHLARRRILRRAAPGMVALSCKRQRDLCWCYGAQVCFDHGFTPGTKMARGHDSDLLPFCFGRFSLEMGAFPVSGGDICKGRRRVIRKSTLKEK
jgi:hypothetical protein